MSTSIWVWLAALLTLCIYSFLYRDNPFYKFAEHLLVGVSLGYAVAIQWHNGIMRRVYNPLVIQHNYWVIIPTLLGLLIFARFVKRWGWLSRWPIAFYVGAFAGMAIPSEFQTYVFEHIQGTIPPVSIAEPLSWGGFFNIFEHIEVTTSPVFTFSSIVMVVGVAATLVYFFFSAEHKGALGRTARVGVYFIMVAFGASFGYTVMARISLLIGRLQFLLHDWLGVIR